MDMDELNSVISEASEQAWERDQVITIKYASATANAEITITPEGVAMSSSEREPAPPAPWRNVLVEKIFGTINGLIALAVVCVIAYSVLWVASHGG